MSDKERLDKFLEEGEVIRWSGTPQPYRLFDETHKTSTIISLSWALVWGILLMGGYYALTASQGHGMGKGVTAICVIISLIFAWGPITDKNNVKKLLYAITDKRGIVVSSGSETACALRIADIDDLRVEKSKGGNCHVRLGSSVFKASAGKLPGLAFRGEFDMENNEKIYKGLVFYNITPDDEKAICNLLKP
ncbi:MAG: hypothetical protein FWG71_00475 [Synergistaceae bacterium]|nr:hypothetical protein [Synergistaceae bacterium]